MADDPKWRWLNVLSWFLKPFQGPRQKNTWDQVQELDNETKCPTCGKRFVYGQSDPELVFKYKCPDGHEWLHSLKDK